MTPPDDLTSDQHLQLVLAEVRKQIDALAEGLATKQLAITRMSICGVQVNEFSDTCRVVVDVEFGPAEKRKIH